MGLVVERSKAKHETDGVGLGQEFVPPSYEREEQQGYVALKNGHLHHPADFIEEDDLGAIPVTILSC